MASIALYLDRTSMDGQIKLKVGFSTMPIIMYSITSFFCAATLASVEKNVRHATGYMLLAHLANLVQLSLWEAELIMRSKNSHEEASTELSVDSTSQNCKIKFTPSFILWRSITLCCVSIVPCLSATFMIKRNILIALGFILIVIRSNLAIARFWSAPALLNSKLFNNLLFTGLKLCEEIVNSNKSDKNESSEEHTLMRGEMKDQVSKVDDCNQLGEDDWEELKGASFYEEGL